MIHKQKSFCDINSNLTLTVDNQRNNKTIKKKTVKQSYYNYKSYNSEPFYFGQTYFRSKT